MLVEQIKCLEIPLFSKNLKKEVKSVYGTKYLIGIIRDPIKLVVFCMQDKHSVIYIGPN